MIRLRWVKMNEFWTCVAPHEWTYDEYPSNDEMPSRSRLSNQWSET